MRFWSCTTSKSALPDSTRFLSAWTSPSSSVTGSRSSALPCTLSNRYLCGGNRGHYPLEITDSRGLCVWDTEEPSCETPEHANTHRYAVSILFAPSKALKKKKEKKVCSLSASFFLSFRKHSELEQVLPRGHTHGAGNRFSLLTGKRWGDSN